MGLQLSEVLARLIVQAAVSFPFTVAIRVHTVLLRGLNLVEALAAAV